MIAELSSHSLLRLENEATLRDHLYKIILLKRVPGVSVTWVPEIDVDHKGTPININVTETMITCKRNGRLLGGEQGGVGASNVPVSNVANVLMQQVLGVGGGNSWE